MRDILRLLMHEEMQEEAKPTSLLRETCLKVRSERDWCVAKLLRQTLSWELQAFEDVEICFR